jgi:hypothetical protein
MKKLVVAVGAAALLAVTSVAAFADEVSGAVASVDTKNSTVTLDNGKTYALPQPPAPGAALTMGDHVTITFTADASTGKLMASSVVTVRPDPKT